MSLQRGATEVNGNFKSQARLVAADVKVNSLVWILGVAYSVDAADAGSGILLDNLLYANPVDTQLQATTTSLINSTTANTDEIRATSGFTTSGDGGGAQWKHNGVTGQTPSQTPAQLGDALLNDGNGNQWALVIDGYVNIESTGAISDALTTKTDNLGAIQAAINAGKSWYVPAGDFGWSGQIDNGVTKLIGDGQQSSKLHCFDATAGTKFKFSSGAILEGVKILGPWSVSQDVPSTNIGVSDANTIASGGGANRAVLRDFRVELFGNNFYFYNTQNSTIDGVMAQYAKYNEFWFDETRNTFVYSANSNGRSGVGAPFADAAYKWLRIDGAKNLRFWGGIHERAEDIVSPVLLENNADAYFNGIELNAATTRIVNVTNSSFAEFETVVFTSSGLNEILIETDSSSTAIINSITGTGLSGKNEKSLLKGNVGVTPFFNLTPISTFRATSGGTGTMEDGVIAVQGGNGVAGIEIDDKPTNNGFIKLTGDGLGSYQVSVDIFSLSGATNCKIHLQTDFAITGGFRRTIGTITTAGHHVIPVSLINGDVPTTIGIGVTWDGVTVDPTYGSVGVARVTGREAKLFR